MLILVDRISFTIQRQFSLISTSQSIAQYSLPSSIPDFTPLGGFDCLLLLAFLSGLPLYLQLCDEGPLLQRHKSQCVSS
jgi:hypothetical protein